jgi:putative sigma-54 modulation protein
MKFTFTEKKVQVSDELRAYAERKIGKLDRFFKIESEAFVTFEIERGRHKAELTLNNNGMFYRVTEITSDMYASIDSAVAAVESQIRKTKAGSTSVCATGPWSASSSRPSATPGTTRRRNLRSSGQALPHQADDNRGGHLAVKQLGHEFFVFRNQDNRVFFLSSTSANPGVTALIESTD